MDPHFRLGWSILILKKQGHFGKVTGWLVVHILRCRLSTILQGNEVPSWSFEYAAFFLQLRRCDSESHWYEEKRSNHSAISAKIYCAACRRPILSCGTWNRRTDPSAVLAYCWHQWSHCPILWTLPIRATSCIFLKSFTEWMYVLGMSMEKIVLGLEKTF